MAISDNGEKKLIRDQFVTQHATGIANDGKNCAKKQNPSMMKGKIKHQSRKVS